MTEEEHGAAEWLRGIIEEYEANGAQSCLAMARMFGIDCEYETCRGCMTKMMAAIVDRIDAERALPEGMEWPRFEDGELVKVGDEVGSDEPFTAKEIAFESERWLIRASSRSACGCFHGGFGEPVNRPTPKVLDADGVPIKVGDTVWAAYGERRKHVVKAVCSDGRLHPSMLRVDDCMVDYEDGGWDFAKRVTHKPPTPEVLDADGVPIKVGDVVYFVADKGEPALTVECIDVSGEKPVVDLVYSDKRGSWHLVNPEKLTHEPPDSWRLWGDDLDMAVKVGEVDKVEMMRRAKALAKKELQ